MRTLTLSDHPGDMLQQMGRRGSGGPRRRAPETDAALAQYQRRVDLARRARDQARAEHRWWAWLRASLALRREARRAPATPDEPARDADMRERIQAGRAGEQAAADRLGRVLGKEWILFRGYCNRRGEIDLLLLGPRGLVAIEVKNHNATVHCDGDRWWYTKYDRYGNAVRDGTIEDAKGRSPSQQVNEAATALQYYLRGQGHDLAIERVVLLTHQRAKVGRCVNPTVRIETSPDAILRLVGESRPVFNAAEVATIEGLVVGDHRRHAQRRPARPRSPR